LACQKSLLLEKCLAGSNRDRLSIINAALSSMDPKMMQ
jgi:hypothetical protein